MLEKNRESVLKIGFKYFSKFLKFSKISYTLKLETLILDCNCKTTDSTRFFPMNK